MRKVIPAVVYKVEYKKNGVDRVTNVEVSPFEHDKNPKEALESVLFDNIVRFTGNHKDGHDVINFKCTKLIESNDFFELTV